MKLSVGMLDALWSKLAPYYKNYWGWSTNRKIVVIESDDWGSIRMPSRDVYEKCLKAGYKVDKIAYERYDSIADEHDLELLFDLLCSFSDYKGNHPVITANAVVANPDFEKIKNSGLDVYHYELITETFKRYPNHTRCFDLWKEGMEQGIYFPQSHGREHLNVSMFMNALLQGDSDAQFGFDHKMPGSIPRGKKGGNKYVESLKYTDERDKRDKLDIILEGLDLFEDMFGYRSLSFIPPNYFWSPDFNEQVSQAGVKYYQGNRKMKEPVPGGTSRIHSHNLGGKNRYDQYYLVRNAVFEPSLQNNTRETSLDQCLFQLDAAFRMRKPAVICSHRINYVGFIDPSNRDENLLLLKHLLAEALKRWPDIEFMNSVQLGDSIQQT